MITESHKQETNLFFAVWIICGALGSAVGIVCGAIVLAQMIIN